MQTVKNTILRLQRFIPAAMLILLYGAGAALRPVTGPDEYRNWFTVPADSGWAAVVWQWGLDGGNVRLVPMLAALAGVLTVWWFVRLHRPVLAAPAAALTALTGSWYFCGTSATPLICWALALLLTVTGVSAVLTTRGGTRIGAALAAAAGIAGVIAGWPILTRLPDFRRADLLPMLLIGSLPLLLLVSPVCSGMRKLDRRSPLARTALAGVVLSLAAAWLGPAGFAAAVPFLAMIWVLALDAVLAEPAGIARFDRVLRNWLVVVLAAALLIFGLQLGIQLKLIDGQYRLYHQPGKYVMVILTAGIAAGWWRFAIREERPWFKVHFFAVGFSILLLAAPTLLTDRAQARIAPAEALRQIALNDGRIAADADLIPALRYLGIAPERLIGIDSIADPQTAVAGYTAEGVFTIVTRQRMLTGFPPPSRRFALIAPGIRIWEYDRR